MVTQKPSIPPVSVELLMRAFLRAVDSDVPPSSLKLFVHLINNDPAVLTSWRELHISALCQMARISAETGRRVVHALVVARLLEERPARAGHGRGRRRDVRVILDPNIPMIRQVQA